MTKHHAPRPVTLDQVGAFSIALLDHVPDYAARRAILLAALDVFNLAPPTHTDPDTPAGDLAAIARRAGAIAAQPGDPADSPTGSGAYIRETYDVPAHRHGHVLIDGHHGVIVGFEGQYLLVQFDGETAWVRAHPTWHVLYLADPAADDRVHLALVYDRGAGRLLREIQVNAADRRRVREELERLAPAEHVEVVVLTGTSRESIQATHSRYWATS